MGVFSSCLMRALIGPLVGVMAGRPAEGRPAEGRGSRNMDKAERGVVAEMAEGMSRRTSLGKLAVDGVDSASVGLRMGAALVRMGAVLVRTGAVLVAMVDDEVRRSQAKLMT